MFKYQLTILNVQRILKRNQGKQCSLTPVSM